MMSIRVKPKNAITITFGNQGENHIHNEMIGKDIKHNLEYIKKSNDTVGKYMVFTFKNIAKFYEFNISSFLRRDIHKEYLTCKEFNKIEGNK